MERSSGAAPSPQYGGSGQDTTLSVRVEDSPDGVAIVSLVGELDLSTIPRMEGALRDQFERRAAVLVDLSALKFIDSSGIGALIQAKRAVNGTPINVLIGKGSQVDRVFGIARVTEALPVFWDRAEALAALASGRGGVGTRD